MKPNIITDGLPKEVVIDDGKYQINWDFRIGMKFDEIMESEARTVAICSHNDRKAGAGYIPDRMRGGDVANL